MSRNDELDRTIHQITLDLTLTKGVLLLSLALAIVFVAFLAGRASVDSPTASSGAATSKPTSQLETNDASVFDRDESPARARYEVDLGEFVDRSAAEARRQAAARSGVVALVVQQPNGKFRVAAGPFESDQQAQRAARRLGITSAASVRRID